MENSLPPHDSLRPSTKVGHGMNQMGKIWRDRIMYILGKKEKGDNENFVNELGNKLKKNSLIKKQKTEYAMVDGGLV